MNRIIVFTLFAIGGAALVFGIGIGICIAIFLLAKSDNPDSDPETNPFRRWICTMVALIVIGLLTVSAGDACQKAFDRQKEAYRNFQGTVSAEFCKTTWLMDNILCE